MASCLDLGNIESEHEIEHPGMVLNNLLADQLKGHS